MARKLPFVTSAIKAAPHVRGTRETEYRIEGNPGLVLVVQPPDRHGISTRSWRYHYSYVKDGRQIKRRVRIGKYPTIMLAAARRRAVELTDQVALGEDPAVRAKSGNANGGATFKDLLDEYLEMRKSVKRICEIERELRKDAIPVIGTMKASSITPADIDAIATGIINRGAAAMARRQIDHLKALFNFCIYDAPALSAKYNITGNPAERLGRHRHGVRGRFAKPSPRNRVLEDWELVEWWRALEISEMRAQTKQALKLILLTGQRPGEVRQAQRDQLRLDAEEPCWQLKMTKMGRPQVVPLSSLSAKLFELALLQSVGDWVFPDPRKPGQCIADVVLPSAQRHLFAARLSHIEPATAHDLRRTAATGMRRIGISRAIVSMVLNHAEQGVTARHYDHWEGLPEKRDALCQWSEHLVRLLGRDSLESGRKSGSRGASR